MYIIIISVSLFEYLCESDGISEHFYILKSLVMSFLPEIKKKCYIQRRTIFMVLMQKSRAVFYHTFLHVPVFDRLITLIFVVI